MKCSTPKFSVVYNFYEACIQTSFSVYYDVKRSGSARDCMPRIVSGGVVYCSRVKRRTANAHFESVATLCSA